MFENGSALYLLLILLPVIILYILKPKPRVFKIPSLLLLRSSPGKKRLRSLFDKLIKDPLLLIQLLAMTIIILGLAGPYYFVNAGNERTVIVLDTSASMSSSDVKPDRFTRALEIAGEYTGRSEKNSLILAQNVPVLLYTDENSKHAAEKLLGLKPEATGTDLNEAIMFALNLIGNKTSNLVIISDFSGQDISGVQKIIESRNIPAEYRQIGIGGNNLGIVDASIEDNSLGFVVRNFNDIPVDTIIKIKNGDSVRTINRTIKPESRDFLKVTGINPGTTGISLEPADDFLLDNMLYISMRDTKNKRILLLSDSPGKSRSISRAFEAIPNLDIDKVSFNSAPRNLDYGMVVLYDYTGSSLLPGTMEDIKNYAASGGTVVFEAAIDLQFLDTKELLPVNVSGITKPSQIEVKISGLTKDIDFGISKYLKGTIKEGSVELASAKEGPILAYRFIGKGKVVYIGTNEDWGDFHLRTSYPIFWYRLLEFADKGELNFKSGTLLPLDSVKNIKGPRLEIRTDKLYLGETGFYDIEGKTIASNLLDEKESDISIPGINFTKTRKVSGSGLEKIHLQTILSLLAILLIGLELYYLKYRGEI